jgi:hypothetical protein
LCRSRPAGEATSWVLSEDRGVFEREELLMAADAGADAEARGE